MNRIWIRVEVMGIHSPRSKLPRGKEKQGIDRMVGT